MKFKSLFLGMLGAAVLVGCNNEIDGPDGPGGKPVVEGESTTATFALRFASPNTYSGQTSVAGTQAENDINNAALFIYKLDGSPEAMAFLANAEYNADKMVTVKCKSGQKLIYLAANIGNDALINTGAAGTSNSLTPGYFGVDWVATPGPSFAKLNAPIWASNAGIELDTAATGPTNTNANNLIKALNANGVPTGTVGKVSEPQTTTGGVFFMSNWGDASTQPADTVTGTGNSYLSTCRYTLLPDITADQSRGAAAAGVADFNHLKINIQRGLAKIAVSEIPSTVLSAAGTGSNAGVFVPDAKWALGNINSSQYPFQLWSGKVVKSTRFDEKESLLDDPSWAKKMDNTRFLPAGKTYQGQNLLVGEVRTAINGHANNLNFAGSTIVPADYVFATENNSKNTYNQYSTFVVFAGQYKPASYITSVGMLGASAIKDSTIFPATWPAKPVSTDAYVTDTMFYVSSYGTDGTFFLGKNALLQYICYVILGKSTVTNPGADADVVDALNKLKEVANGDQAKLQEYYQGYCFYRVWINDPTAAESANKTLVRRNHVYNLAISNIKGPGIGDPNDIIDPHPEEPDPIIDADTYVTATITVMDWHIVAQTSDLELN